MLAKMISATFNSTTGRVNVILDTSTSAGYSNNCQQYQAYGVISVPKPGQLVEIDQQSSAQVNVIGYNNQVIDSNFALNAGETSVYGDNWYITNSINGVVIQEAQTANIENQMMGQSTNSVLEDILTYLIGLEAYIATHVHSGCGGLSDSGAPTAPPPDVGGLPDDLTYISDNKNLAITGTYTPHIALEAIRKKLEGLKP